MPQPDPCSFCRGVEHFAVEMSGIPVTATRVSLSLQPQLHTKLNNRGLPQQTCTISLATANTTEEAGV